MDLPSSSFRLQDLPIRNKTSYYFDFRTVMRYFPKEMRIALRFGDVRDVTDYPRIVKTRPLGEVNENSVLLKLNSIRHFRKIEDNQSWAQKKDLLVWRGKVKRDHRREVFLKHFFNPLCDLGQTNGPNSHETPQWTKPFLSIKEQLKYKFILSIEGNEVATNLKWIAQSNSLCFMIKPKFESWFMEGKLVGGYHYVELNDNYSDLSSKIDYYLKHPMEAQKIVENMNAYYQQFEDEEREHLISLLVVRKYLRATGQIDIEDHDLVNTPDSGRSNLQVEGV